MEVICIKCKKPFTQKSWERTCGCGYSKTESQDYDFYRTMVVIRHNTLDPLYQFYHLFTDEYLSGHERKQYTSSYLS